MEQTKYSAFSEKIKINQKEDDLNWKKMENLHMNDNLTNQTIGKIKKTNLQVSNNQIKNELRNSYSIKNKNLQDNDIIGFPTSSNLNLKEANKASNNQIIQNKIISSLEKNKTQNITEVQFQNIFKSTIPENFKAYKNLTEKECLPFNFDLSVKDITVATQYSIDETNLNNLISNYDKKIKNILEPIYVKFIY